MRLRNVPGTNGRGFIEIWADVDGPFDLREQVCKLKICRSRESGVASQDKQCLNAPLLQLIHKFPNRLLLIHRDGLRGLGVRNCLSYISEMLVQQVCDRVDDGRLRLASNHDATPASALEIFA